jgi:hypothetical protein
MVVRSHGVVELREPGVRSHGVTGARSHGVVELREPGVRSHGVTGARSHGVVELREPGVTGVMGARSQLVAATVQY